LNDRRDVIDWQMLGDERQIGAVLFQEFRMNTLRENAQAKLRQIDFSVSGLTSFRCAERTILLHPINPMPGR
jgi:hypothetical protein